MLKTHRPSFAAPTSPAPRPRSPSSSFSSPSPLRRRARPAAPQRSRADQLRVLHALISRRQRLNATASAAKLPADRSGKLTALAAAAVGLSKKGVPLRALPANYGRAFTTIFEPCPNVFTLALSLDTLLSLREMPGSSQLVQHDLTTTSCIDNHPEPDFGFQAIVNSVIEVLLHSRALFTPVYLGYGVFDPACPIHTAPRVTGSRKLCHTSLRWNKVITAATANKPWFELHNTLETEIADMILLLRELREHNIDAEANIIRAIIGLEGIEKHFQMRPFVAFILQTWSNRSRARRFHRRERASRILRQFYIESYHIKWGYDSITREQQQANPDDVDDDPTTHNPNDHWDTSRPLLTRKFWYFWREWALLSAKAHFEFLLLESEKESEFLNWDISRIRNFMTGLKKILRKLRQEILAAPHELALKQKTLRMLSSAANASGTSDERERREIQMQEALYILFDFGVSMGPTESERLAEAVGAWLCKKLTRGKRTRDHNLVTAEAFGTWEHYEMHFANIYRHVLSFLDPSIAPSGPLHAVSRAHSIKACWGQLRWYKNGARTVRGWGWFSSTTELRQLHRAAFMMVSLEKMGKSAGAKQVAFERFRKKNNDLVKRLQSMKFAYAQKGAGPPVIKKKKMSGPFFMQPHHDEPGGIKVVKPSKKGGKKKGSGGAGTRGRSSKPSSNKRGSSPKKKGNRRGRSLSSGRTTSSPSAPGSATTPEGRIPFGQKRSDWTEWDRLSRQSRKKIAEYEHRHRHETQEILKHHGSASDDRERRQALEHENKLRSLSEQREFVCLSDSLFEQLLKFDATATAGQTKVGVKETTPSDIEFAVKMACPTVRRVYNYYRSGPVMSKSDYIQFIQQSKVVSRNNEAGLQAADIELLWLKCSHAHETSKSGGVPNLLPHQFMEVCLRIGAIKYESATPSLPLRIERLCDQDLRWNARQSDADAFRLRLVDADVLVSFDRFYPAARAIFKEWSRKGRMGMRQWRNFVKTMMLEESSSRLGSRNVDLLFHKAQSGSADDLGDEGDVGGPASGPTTTNEQKQKIKFEADMLDCLEFWEVLAGLSVYEDPDPFTTMGTKIRRYCEAVLLPRAEAYDESGEHGVKNHVQRENV